MAYTAEEKAAEAEREVSFREHVYKKQVEQGRMTLKDAARRIAIMGEIAADYRTQAQSERLI